MGISIWQLLIILVIVIVLFGTKKLKNIGGDLGDAIKNFRSSMRDGENNEESKAQSEESKAQSKETPVKETIQSQVAQEKENKGKIIEGEITDKQVNKAV
ncbi:MAG: twin-arginine translocase TatA/TatE family subunit [Thiomargarita sp.]|nr:twin-arginine translocase TatA/TatE family subunit [Thiomargarita sp.]